MFAGRQGGPSISGGTIPQTWQGGMGALLCPSDKVPCSDTRFPLARRTYAMPEHSMDPTTPQAQFFGIKSWPPSSDNTCGVGLRWEDSITPNRSWNSTSQDVWGNAAIIPRNQAAVNASMVLDQTGTLYITEKPRADSMQGSVAGQTILTSGDHVDGRTDTRNYHNSMYNYLFVDGRAETLAPSATLGETNTIAGRSTGMWTIRARD